ncbi:MAG: 16S rRNA (uracil(1498)-N(3))-methyltransferase, partial [bacterium]
PVSFGAFLDSPQAEADLAVFLDDRADAQPRPAPKGTPRRIVLFVGPEGGFADAERESLATRAFPWIIGGRVLRAETAVLVGLAAVHLAWGDFRDRPGDPD